MTTPPTTSPLRIAGVALIGLAVISALAGLVSLGTSSGGTDQAAAPSNLTVTTVAPAPAPTAEPTPAEPTFTEGDGLAAPPAGAVEPTPPAVTTPAPAPARAESIGSEVSAIRSTPVRVYNNSTIKGLASRAAEDFRRAGWRVDEVGNYPHGIIPTSTVYFTPKSGEETAAQELGRQFGLRVAPRFEGIQNASPGLIVIVTRDYHG